MSLSGRKWARVVQSVRCAMREVVTARGMLKEY